MAMASSVGELQGEDLFFGYISEYLDGELPAGVSAKFNELLATRQASVEAFQENRGKFQSALGDLCGSESLKHKLRNIAQDDQIRETQEISAIAEAERSETVGTLIRRSVLAVILLSLVGGVVFLFMPRPAAKFDVIEYLGYEALALEEDPEGRMNLPSTDLEEIRQFVKNVPGLAFSPSVLRPLQGWNPEGVAVIDYEVMKVIAVNYVSPERNSERLHHFMVPGKMAKMPYTGTEADYRGIRFRQYSGDKLNVVVWQHTPDMISVLAGRRGTAELYELARAGTPE